MADPINTILFPNIHFDFEAFLRFGLMVFLIAYTIISIVVIKQIGLMTKTVKTPTNTFVYIIAYLHLFIVLCCLAFVIFFL